MIAGFGMTFVSLLRKNLLCFMNSGDCDTPQRPEGGRRQPRKIHHCKETGHPGHRRGIISGPRRPAHHNYGLNECQRHCDKADVCFGTLLALVCTPFHAFVHLLILLRITISAHLGRILRTSSVAFRQVVWFEQDWFPARMHMWHAFAHFEKS